MNPRLGSLLLLALACAPAAEPPGAGKPALETEEVTAAPHAALSTAADAVESRSAAPALAGALPAGFPREIPVYRPSSLVESGELGGGRRFVELESPDPPAVVRAALERRLAAAGWNAEGGGAYRLAELRLQVVVTGQAAGSRLRLEF